MSASNTVLAAMRRVRAADPAVKALPLRSLKQLVESVLNAPPEGAEKVRVFRVHCDAEPWEVELLPNESIVGCESEGNHAWVYIAHRGGGDDGTA